MDTESPVTFNESMTHMISYQTRYQRKWNVFSMLIFPFLVFGMMHESGEEEKKHLSPAESDSAEKVEEEISEENRSKLHAGAFSLASMEQNLPDPWEEMTFRRLKPTRYNLVKKEERVVVRASSDQSSSGMILRQEVDLTDFPVIEWTWKVENVLERGDVYSKDGDDYPARIYVIFDYDLGNLKWTTRNMIRLLRRFYGEVPARAINYIYASHAETGKVVVNPYTDLVKMIVVDSGEDHLGEWRTYRRNIYEDYIAIYGEEPPPVGGLAIMTDSDDTGESAVAYFGDICFFRE